MEQEKEEQLKQGIGEIKEAREDVLMKDQDAGFSPLRVIEVALVAFLEIFDWATAFLNLTGAWIVVAFIVNLLGLFFLGGLKMLRHGFSFKNLFGTWKQALWLVIEFIPVVGDIIPGFVLWMFFGKTKGKKTKVKLQEKPSQRAAPRNLSFSPKPI